MIKGASLPEWLTAFGTVGAVVVALGLGLAPGLRRRFYGPKLDVTIEPRPPDCIKIETSITVAVPPGNELVTVTEIRYYARMKVWNRGGRSAESARNVQVQAIGLQVRGEDGAFHDDPSFMPLNLKWSHTGAINHPVIHPGLFRHCDVGSLSAPDNGFLVQFELQTEVRPNPVAEHVWPTIKGPGVYRLSLVIVADDVTPLHRVLELRVGDQWFDDDTAMFTKGFDVKVIGTR